MSTITYDDLCRAQTLMKKDYKIPDVIFATPEEEMVFLNMPGLEYRDVANMSRINGIPIFVYYCEYDIITWIDNFKMTRGREPQCIRLDSK